MTISATVKNHLVRVGMRRIYFPFIGKHPLTREAIRSNARHNQTFDQIAFFLGSKEKNLPNDTWRDRVKDENPDGFNYGVFDFANLFSMVLKNTPYVKFTTAEKMASGKKFEHSVSDHMPIWVRIPRPGFEAT